jgi:predicted permease
VDTRGTEFSPDRRIALYASVLERLRSSPGVLSVSLSTRTPIDLSSRLNRIEVPGFQARGVHGVSPNVVAPAYFTVFGIRLLRGREFTMADHATAPKVAVVSQSMARFYFGDSDPIGRTILLGGKNAITIVGVVEDIRHERLTAEDLPKMVYTPLAQTASFVNFDGSNAVPERVTLALRTDAAPQALLAALRAEIRGLDRTAMVSYVRTFAQQLDAAVVRERLLATLSSAFAAFALLLACVGLYGTMSYHVARRSRDIAIRLALGAARVTVLGQVLREALTVSAAGILFGAIAAFWATGAMSTFLFQVSARDPLTLTSVVAILLTTALVAGYLPARRAAIVEPVAVLKAE